jgi:hypothetical protein
MVERCVVVVNCNTFSAVAISHSPKTEKHQLIVVYWLTRKAWAGSIKRVGGSFDGRWFWVLVFVLGSWVLARRSQRLGDLGANLSGVEILPVET